MLYRLKKALERGDQAAALEIRKSLTDTEWTEFKKSLDGDADLIRGFWDPQKKNFSALHPRPEQQRPAAAKKPGPVIISGEGTSRRVRLERGAIVHWVAGDQLLHGKVRAFGPRGAMVLTADGDEWQVALADLREGVHPDALAEYTEKMHKAEEARDRRAWSVLVNSATDMDPDDKQLLLAEIASRHR